VDDEQSLVNSARQTLMLLGYNVTTRIDPLEALELFKASHAKFDLVITDLTMPQMNGDELAREFKQIRADIPVMLCSGLDTRVSRERIAEAGICAVINKPILRSELAEAVRRVLDQAGQRQPDPPDRDSQARMVQG
ncbi:MAG: response regulator, partial [Desulfosarcinaceae bacterium]